VAKKSGMRGGNKADREFVSEAEEILETMRARLADLSDRLGAGAEADPESVNALFRAAHSLKALAGLFRFDPISDLAHRLEDVLDGMRLGRVALSAALLEWIDEVVALFASLLGQVGDAGALADSAARIAELSAGVGAITAPAAPADDFASLALDANVLRALTEYEEHRLRENLRRGRLIALVDAPFEIKSFEEGLAELSGALRESGEVLSTLPSPGDAGESQIRFSLLVGSDLGEAELAARIEFPGATMRVVRAGRARPQAAPGAAPAAAAPVGPVAPSEPPAASFAQRAEGERRPSDEDASAAIPELESLKSISDTVRVDIRKLDDLMNLVGELVIQRGAIADLIARLTERSETARIGSEFVKVHKVLDRKIRELQSAVLEVRMVPLRQVFEKVSRVVRRLRRELGKQVELEIRGADTELDKLIVEALVDPLMHVVRNALDHAIEPADERRALLKDETGKISIEAFQRGSHVVIEVRDDGRGIDRAALRRRAEQAGRVQPGEALTDKETLDLIFAPGVSTREEVTETSGRGVGMDIVRSNLAALGGVVDVETTPGRGTAIAMTLPITLAIIQSLIVGVRDRRFAIPLNSVLETLVVDPAAIQTSEGRALLNLRGTPLLLRRIDEEFALTGGARAPRPCVIVIGVGEQRIGLIVDRLEGQQDTVIKPIQGPVQNLRGFSGATDLGDQDPVLVLDLSALVEDALRRREAA
jgi:two-component system chemotaxis sensor kinase CheA